MDSFVCLHVTPKQAFLWFAKEARARNKGYLVEQVENGGYGSDLFKVMQLTHLLGISVRLDHFVKEKEEKEDDTGDKSSTDHQAEDTRLRRRYRRRV